jgi:hypothetical protein
MLGSHMLFDRLHHYLLDWSVEYRVWRFGGHGGMTMWETVSSLALQSWAGLVCGALSNVVPPHRTEINVRCVHPVEVT